MGALSTDDLPAAKPSGPERMLSALAAASLAILCVIVTTTVVVRAMGWVLIPDDVLLVQELMVAVILLPMAVVTAQRQHIAVTVFTERAPLDVKTALALLGHLVGVVFSSALLWVGLKTLLAALQSGEYYDGDLNLPVWIGYAVFSLGAGLFLLRVLVMMVLDARRLVRGDRRDG